MKIRKLSKGYFISAIAILVLIICGFIVWHYVLPYYAASRLIKDWEDACKSRDSKRVFELVYAKSSYHSLIAERGTKRLFDEFAKFEPGVRFLEVLHGFGSVSVDKDDYKELIFVKLTKVAKKDNRDRKFTEIELVKVSGKWKILKYFFPDVVNY
jgi:hypothetical protein